MHRKHVEKSRELVSQMTLAEKMAQMVYQAPAIERLNVPAYNWWNECLHGYARSGTATVFPQAIGMAASFNTDLMYQVASAIGDEARAKYNGYKTFGDTLIYQGVTCWSPNINIFRDPRWGRGHETYGEDPYLTAQMGIAFVRGLQGDHPIFRKTDATLKHYAVHSGPESERHGFDALVSLKDLFETYLEAFRLCIRDARPAAVMGAYNRVNGEACCASPFLLQEVLRGRFGFDGYVVSDCGAIADINRFHHLTKDEAESAALAVKSGCDLNCGTAYAALKAAFLRGLIDEPPITTSVERLFAARSALGHFEASPYDALGDTVIHCKKHQGLALQMARESIVLLKNNGILPLDMKKIRRIAVIGPNCDERSVLIGNYNGLPMRYTTIFEGIQDAVPDTVRLYKARGRELLRPNKADYAEKPIREAILAARSSDVVILCTGLRPDVEGEEGDAYNSDLGGDRRDISLPEAQSELFDALSETNTPIIIVNTSGGPVSLTRQHDRAAAILQAWYPGQSGGTAVSDVLFGRYNPSGKLPVTVYQSTGDLPDFRDYAMDGRTYRYMKSVPLYPFGFGLSYSRFRLKTQMPAGLVTRRDENVTCSVCIENQGPYDGQETIQVYLRHEDCPVRTPQLQLVSFEKVNLRAGERKTIQLTIPADRFLIVDEAGQSRYLPGRALLFIGCALPVERSTQLGAPDYLSVPLELI
ncbi:MAG: glycoside hydrolase family 3 C-terminal domain-containing protein [Clostridia bacterium]|nr:glycoside hydrolase family 3 C-terminal domain-containing protein [Clostridia bacterium]